MGEATKRKALMENAYNYKCCISAELILIVTPSPAFRTVSRHKFQRMNYLGSCIKIAVLPLTTWQWIMCRFHWKHLIRLWIMHEWWRGNHQKKTLLITYTMSHQARNKTICRTECSPPTREGQRHEFSIFAWFTDVIQQFIFIEQSQGIYSYVQAFCLRCPLKQKRPGHWPSASVRDSRARDEYLCGRACCGGWTGSASQCSRSEDGGSRWPYTVPALGGSRGGKKYLNQQDDGYTDGEETIEYGGNT